MKASSCQGLIPALSALTLLAAGCGGGGSSSSVVNPTDSLHEIDTSGEQGGIVRAG